jgi:hypothetical protein
MKTIKTLAEGSVNEATRGLLTVLLAGGAAAIPTMAVAGVGSLLDIDRSLVVGLMELTWTAVTGLLCYYAGRLHSEADDRVS